MLAALAVMGAASACGGSEGAAVAGLSAGTSAAEVGDRPAAEPTVIRMALAPDPVWQWLEDSGARAAWERTHNIRIEVSHPFDPFAAFAGGHADVVLVNALDVPNFVEQPERELIIIGKYTTDRTVLAARRTSRAENLQDLVERRIAVESSLASTLLWGLIADVRYDLRFAADGADFDLVIVDSAGLADLVMSGDVDACICNPDFSVPFLAEERLRVLYDGQPAGALYTDSILVVAAFGQGFGAIAEAFAVDAAWRAANPQAVDAFLGLWDEGVAAWKRDRAQIVADYPHHFSVQSDAEIAWLTDYLAAHDWIVPSVYITPKEAETHYYAFDRLKALGLLPADADRPRIDVYEVPAASTSGADAGG